MKEMKFEEALKRLEEIIHQLEEKELPLEESLRIFEEGVRLYKLCNGKLSEAEQKITMIIEENNEIKEVPFKEGGE